MGEVVVSWPTTCGLKVRYEANLLPKMRASGSPIDWLNDERLEAAGNEGQEIEPLVKEGSRARGVLGWNHWAGTVIRPSHNLARL